MSVKAELYRTLGTATNVLNAEIKKQIVESGAVDTGRMKNVTMVKINWRDGENNISLDIDTTEYYKYVSKASGDITKKFLARSKVKDQLEKIYAGIIKIKMFESLGN